MSKAIVILEMPDSCSECKFLDDSSDYPRCIVTDETQGYRFNTYAERMGRCPLLNVNSETTEDPHSLAADAPEVRHGEWIPSKVEAIKTTFICSECNKEVDMTNDYFGKPSIHVGKHYPYCHCGALMDGKK